MKIEILPEFSENKPITKKIFSNDNMVVVHFYLKEGQKIPMHSSPSTVIVTVLKGEGNFFIENEENFVSLKLGESYLYKPKQPHGFIALKDMVVQAVISPNPSVTKIVL